MRFNQRNIYSKENKAYLAKFLLFSSIVKIKKILISFHIN